MNRLFVMEDLRTLAARALADGDYTPAESARVRAVPDTRTIRYYTTLGLLKPPAEMRGRTAFYNETHVLQIVAIKRLQAGDLSLSDIQRRLAGLPNGRLAALARLPDGFWQAADKYLEKRQRQADKKRTQPSGKQPVRAPTEPPARTDDEEFWLTPAALPTSVSAGACEADAFTGAFTNVSLQASIELNLAGGVSMHIQFPSNKLTHMDSTTVKVLDTAALLVAAQPLLKELIRQKIISPSNPAK